MEKKYEKFRKEREELNEIVLKYAKTDMKRFFGIDTQVYKDKGVLDSKTKEMLGLVASTVMRCDDCISYHTIQCAENSVNSDEFEEIMSIAFVVGGSITIPHIRRAFQLWEELQSKIFIPEKYSDIYREIDNSIRLIDDDKLLLQNICDILKQRVEHYDWVGFYLVDKKTYRELILGPFSGEDTDHRRIKFGEGICGQAADKKEVFLIQDVSKESNYLSCSPVVKSEIVVPVFYDNEIIGEIDIDSHKISPFSEEDTLFLEALANRLSKNVFSLT